jgi:hypothetical protein
MYADIARRAAGTLAPRADVRGSHKFGRLVGGQTDEPDDID